MNDRQLIFGVDFDGTIVTHEFPYIGDLVPGALKTIRYLQKNGHMVFLWTMRGTIDRYPRCLMEAKSFLQQHGMRLDGYNQSPEQFSNSPKQFANLYIDDSNMGCPLMIYKDKQVVDWEVIAKELMKLYLLTTEQYEDIETECRNAKYDENYKIR